MTRRPLFPGALLAIALLSQVGLSVAQQGVAVLAVFLRDRNHLSLPAMGGLVSATTLGMMLANVSGGAVVDRVGPRPVAALSSTGAALVLVVLAVRLPGGYLPLASLFAALGLLVGPVAMAGARAVFGAYPPARRGLAMGIRQTGVPLGGAVAAAFLPLAVERRGLAFTFLALAGGLWGPAWLLAWAAGPWAGAKPHGPARRDAVADRAVAHLVACARAVGRPAVVGLLLSAGQYDLLAYTIVDLRGRASLSVAQAGLVLALVQVGGAVGRVLFGWWSDRGGHTRAGVASLVAAGGTVLFAVLAAWPADAPPLALGLLFLLLGAAGAGWNGLVVTWAAEAAGSGTAGLGMGLAASSVFLGATLFPPVFGALVRRTGSFAAGWGLLAAQYAVAAALAAGGDRRPSGRRGGVTGTVQAGSAPRQAPSGP